MANEKKSAWDFVEEFYPKYHSAQEIAESDDLSCILDGMIKKGINKHKK